MPESPIINREPSEFPFAVSVGAVYEGPLDLLLDLIRKQDIDIYDIPIAKITAQYLGYVENLKQLGLRQKGCSHIRARLVFDYMRDASVRIKRQVAG